MELEFRKYWSLKEAFTKARGDGIAFGLNQTDFRLMGSEAELYLEGKEQTRWRFFVSRLDTHICSVALGPPDEVIDAYGGFSSMLLRKNLTTDDYKLFHGQPVQQFYILNLDDLLAGKNFEASQEMQQQLS
eukprot:TRINITY_DN4844_c0_g1_i3.p3 TRINITY_DN4844_c0_g1~~TRINITY_DN4844_c0_g1_i3.p3  ORF type:complete len:131 (+),score=14.26 TRINITY_DN4844_c0_g1_i3:120-512(+)